MMPLKVVVLYKVYWSDDDFYVTKLNEKLCEGILEVLKTFVDNKFQQKGLEDQEFKFKYYHTSSDDNTELGVKVFQLLRVFWQG